MRSVVVFAASCSLLVACGGSAPPVAPAKLAASADAPRAEALPDKRPADFALSYSLEDGSGAKATNLSCDGSGCLLTQLANGEIDRAKADVTPAALDAVFDVVKAQRFAEVAYVATKPPADGTGVTLWVKAGDYYGAMHLANEDAAKADKRFDALRAAVVALAGEAHLALDKPLPGVLPRTPSK